MATPVTTEARPGESSNAASRWTRLIYILFFISGISGLMYEVVWVRMLTRVLGCTVFATSTVLSGFMAGLAIGSLIVGRFVDRQRRLLLVYAWLEFGIAFSAILVSLLPQQFAAVYETIFAAASGNQVWLTVVRVAIALVVLVVPASLMGATLPTLCAFGARRSGAVGRNAGIFYALNTLGGVTGVLGSGFILIGAWGETNTILLGAFLNCLAGAGALALHWWIPSDTSNVEVTHQTELGADLPPEQIGNTTESIDRAKTRRVVIFCFGASGLVALANEVVWSRLLVLHQGTSIYAFSAMLGVMLAGMAIGSYGASRLLHFWSDHLRVMARMELAIAMASAAAIHVFDWLGVPNRPDLATHYEARVRFLILAPALLIGPLAILWGALFPVAVQCYTKSIENAGRSIAELYAWNTLGCIAGPLLAGFVLIPAIGTSRTAVSVAALSGILGLLLLGVHHAERKIRKFWMEGAALAAAVVLLVTVKDPYYRHLERRMGTTPQGPIVPLVHVEEAAGTTTVFSRSPDNSMDRVLWVNGMGMTVLVLETKLMAHIPIALAENPRDVLVVCVGMGTTMRSASRHEGLNIWAVEMMPAVLDCIGYFHADGPALLDRPNIHAVADDGRSFLLARSQQYDVITVDPAPPIYSAGTVNLYSREFFELCRRRLRPGGVMCLWVPAANQSEVKMILRTFLSVFDHTSVWSGVNFPGLYLLGSQRPFHDMSRRIHRLYEEPAVVQDLTEWGDECAEPEDLLRLQIASGSELGPLLSGSPIISDDRPYTEFPLWRALYGGTSYSRTLDGALLRVLLARPR